ncbi:LysM peptidoglycan-binding domain-containing protein [Aquirufa sp. ROCK-SH2]
MNTKKSTLLIIFCLLTFFTSNASTLDSLGLKKENNKTFILYKLGPKQSLFSILKRYNISLTEFKQVNPETDIPVKTGEIVYIPLHYLEESPSILKSIDKTVAGESSTASTPAEKAPVTADKKEEKYHIVKSKQGLLTIANLYKVSMADLRKWNNLTSDRLQEGQRLVIQEPSLEKTNLLPSKAEKPASEGKIDMTIPAPVSETKAENTADGLKKTIENGIAELIDVPDNSGKYLALHKTAPIGTLVLVKNLANNQSIWVKVIGRLPNSDSKLIIKLSPKAFEKLNAVDKRIRAEISYLVQ